MKTGTVLWLARNAHFGFARPDDAKADAFFHHDDLDDAAFRGIEVGSRVIFELVPASGRTKAINVRLIEEATAEPVKYGARS